MSKKFIFISITVGLTALVCFGLAAVQAGSDDNISGFAWSENIGWVSFNSISDGGPVDYGVDIDLATGVFSGYAWSEYIGWIDFAPAGPYLEAPNNAARYDSVTGEVSGWVKILSLGDDGWLKLRGSTPDYGVSIDAAGDFHGWAWNDSIGWLNFNSADAGAGGNYKVFILNNPPSASDLNVSTGGTATYCVNAAAHYFSWTYSDPDGDDESQFQFQVDDNSDFSSPEIDRDYNELSNPSPTTNNQSVIVAVSPGSDKIVYNTTYYWRVKVYDEEGVDSGWVEGVFFTTEKHQYPSINFNWSPQEPSIDEDVLFADQSTVFGGAIKSSWSWSFEDGNPGSSPEQNPTIQFTISGDKEVTLEVTDSDGYACSKSQIVNAQWSLPDWKEILPW